MAEMKVGAMVDNSVCARVVWKVERKEKRWGLRKAG